MRYRPPAYSRGASPIGLFDDFQFIDSDFDRLPHFDLGLFAGLDFLSFGFDRIAAHAFDLIGAVIALGQDRVFAADFLVAFEFQVDEEVFRAASDLDSVFVRCEGRFPLARTRIGDGKERGAWADDGPVGVFRNRAVRGWRRFRLRRRGLLLSRSDFGPGRIVVPDGLDANLPLVERAVNAQ